MTDLLKRTLSERAASAEPPDLDLDAVITAGDRRIRRRRVVAVAGAALVTLAVIAGGLTAARLVSPDDPPPVAAFSERRATYAVGSEIHYGRDVISVAPNKVSAFVQTDAGFVFATPDAGVFVVDSRGVRRIMPDETTTELVADHRGSLVGWVEMHNNATDSVVYDVAAGRELVRTAIRNDHGQGSIWPSVPRQANRAPPSSTASRHSSRPVPSTSSPSQRPALADPRGSANDALMGIEPGWAALQLFEVATGREVGLPYAYPTLRFGQWLDDNTFTAAGERRSTPSAKADLLTCSTQSGACEVAAPAFSTFTFS
jgi:hypothetical protein